jgi:hypothetical protein
VQQDGSSLPYVWVAGRCPRLARAVHAGPTKRPQEARQRARISSSKCPQPAPRCGKLSCVLGAVSAAAAMMPAWQRGVQRGGGDMRRIRQQDRQITAESGASFTRCYGLVMAGKGATFPSIPYEPPERCAPRSHLSSGCSIKRYNISTVLSP